jgi:transcriptional regulator with XRE-family HTH domain
MGEVQRLVELLRMVIRTFGTNREVERKLGMRPGYLSRIFGGAVELRVEHILAVCRALEVAPGEFFALAFPTGPEPVTEAGRKMFARLRPQGQPVVPALPQPKPAAKPGSGLLTAEEVDARIRSTMGEFLVAFGKLFGGGGSGGG